MQPRRSIVLDMTTTGTLADLAAQARALIVTGQARELRLRAGYALTDAAKASGGVHASAVLRWEQGRIPRGRNLKAHVRFLRKLAEREAVTP